KVTGGRLPQWTTWWDEDDVAVLFPDPQTRLRVSAEQPRLPLSYYEQQIPVPGGWDSRPCGYLLFGPPYDRMAHESRERGSDVDHVPGQHLHQLVDPDTVTARIVAMTGRWGVQPDAGSRGHGEGSWEESPRCLDGAALRPAGVCGGDPTYFVVLHDPEG